MSLVKNLARDCRQTDEKLSTLMKTYNALKKLTLGVTLIGLVAWQASATVTYNFTYSGGTGTAGSVTASGWLSGNVNGNGSVTVTSGSYTGTAGIIGTFSLVSNPNAPTASLSPGGIVYDDILFPNSDSPSHTYLDADGILFASGSHEVGIYNNSGGSYGIAESFGSGFTNPNSGGTFTLSLVPVPEASTFAVAGVALLGLVYVGRCYARKLKVA